MRHLLRFGDDGSRAADVAWLWINSHRWPGWDLETVCAIEPEGAVPRQRLPFSEAGWGSSQTVVSDDDPRLALSATSDLLVVGDRGRVPAMAACLGSTTEWLLVRPPAPMVIVRHGRRTESVLLCTDGSASATLAVRTLAAMPWISGLEVMVVGVVDGCTAAEEAVHRATTLLSVAGAAVRQRVLHGDATDLLADLAHETPHDLLVAGTRGLTGIERLRLGSTAARITHTSPASVLLACARPCNSSEVRTDDCDDARGYL